MHTWRPTTARTPARRTAALLSAVLLAGPAAAAAPTSAPPPSNVLVTSLAGDVAAAAAAVRAAGGRVVDTLSLVGGVSAELPAGAVLAPAYRVLPDRPLHVAGSSSGGTGPVSTVRGTLGLGAPANEGADVTVAVVDTGVANVPDLAGRVDHVDVTGTGGGDGFGHGTFVAGLIAGSGSKSGGAYAGVAPGASVLDVRVADDEGSTSLLRVLKGLQVVAQHPEVSVLNLSLSSGSALPYQVDPLTVALEALWRRGVTVVVPAGNGGAAEGITSPGSDPLLLTAGALDENGTSGHADDVVPAWSGRGPAAQGVAKPDLVAPGTHVVSLRAPRSVIDSEHSEAQVGKAYFLASGTSFSTAVTSGAAAALLARRPSLTPTQVKAALTRSAYDGLGDARAAGAGGLDLRAAYRHDVSGASSPSYTAAPGQADVWRALLAALADGDVAAAASSWSQLGPAARAWAASSWSALSPQMQAWLSMNWAASSWSRYAASSWSSINWAAVTWASMNWASQNWASMNWASVNWASVNWASVNWASMNWALAHWSGSSWSSQNWASVNWASMNWTSQNWASLDWASQNWASMNWTSVNWASQNWASQNWASQNWASQNWASQNWG